MERSFWQSIIKNEYVIPSGYTVQVLTPDLIDFLGSADLELRDTFGYPILDAWIKRGYYSSSELSIIAERMADNLQIGIGEKDTDSVFLRSFSALIFGDVLNYDNHYHFFSQDDVRFWLEVALEYLAAEQDMRGYVLDKGWAHALAHIADLLMILAQSRYLLRPELERILMALADKLLDPVEFAYMYVEDERLAYTVMTILRRNLVDQMFLYGWLDRLIYAEGHVRWSARHFTSPSGPYIYANVRNFLRSLYFQLSLAGNSPPIAPMLRLMIQTALEVMDHGFYTLG